MIKRDIARLLYERHGGLSLEETKDYTSILIDLLKDSVLEHPEVTVTHFGKFRHKNKSGREIALPTGEILRTPPSKRVQFLPSPALKTFLNAQPTED